ncbi:MAG TPA: N-acetyl-gamma-glutamyl-phosphate reductase [Candidatus Altiarchaeales archaeon]|nr:N-acetyl-gamma-glutamyl-phosphate reductase [Candidatus Altiarchaeales archaeon]
MKALVVGGSGYTGGELLRILSLHPKVDEVTATSRTYEGRDIPEAHPNLTKVLNGKFRQYKGAGDADIVFLCLPHTKSMEAVPELLNSGVKVIDLSADYRISDKQVFEKYYCIHKNPELLKKAVYGLPELNRAKIKKASLIANPGCYVTSALLGLIPLMGEKKLDLEHIIVDAKSGTSGAGVKPTQFLHASEVADNLKPYKVIGHRHQPEIDFILQGLNPNASVNFTPTLAPFSRGIQETIHIFGEIDDPVKIFEKKYAKEPFVRVVSESTVKNVAFSNYCDIAVFYDNEKQRLVVVSSIDNLIKGASGQAVENMNLMMGYGETEGLQTLPYHP